MQILIGKKTSIIYKADKTSIPSAKIIPFTTSKPNESGLIPLPLPAKLKLLALLKLLVL